MKKALAFFLFLPSIGWGSAIFNPGSGTGGGGGASTLETYVGNSRSSPTATVGFYGGDFSGAVVGSSMTIILNPNTTDFIRNNPNNRADQFNISSGTFSNQVTTFNLRFSTNSAMMTTFDGSNFLAMPDANTMYFGRGSGLTPYTASVFNNCVGPNCMANNGTETFSNCMGASCMANATLSGQQNNCQGYACQANRTSANFNTCVGGSCQLNIANDVNTCIGVACQATMTNSVGNTCVGVQCQFDQTAGLYNTAFGYRSGESTSAVNANVLGNYDTHIGYETGQSVSSNTAISKCIALGYHALCDASNQAQIGGRNGSGDEVNLRVSTITIDSLASGLCVQTTTNGRLTTSGSACGTGSGGGSSPIAFTSGTYQTYANPAISSPTSVGIFRENQFIVRAVGTTGYFELDPSSVTLQGNSITFNSLQTQITATGVSTGSLQTQLINVGIATASLRTADIAIGLSTGSLQTQVTATGVSTGSLQTQVTNLGVSTGTIAANFPVKIGSGTVGPTTFDVSLTSSSSNGAGGEFVKYQLSVGSMTGAGLGTCGDATHGLGWSSTNNLFTCQSITGSGGGGGSSLAVGTGTSAGWNTSILQSSPTSVLLFDKATTNGQLQGGSTYFFTLNSTSVTLQGNTFNGANQLLQANASGLLPDTNLSSNVMLLNSSQTVSAAKLFNSSTALNGGMYFANYKTVSANYTALSTDTVILASAPATGLIITLPSVATSTGLVLTITKVSQSTYPVTINANGTADTILGTGTLTLNGYGQTDSIIAVGNNLWAPYGQGLQLTPDYIGPGMQGTTANTINVASTSICGSFYNTVPVQVDSMTVHIGTVSDRIEMGIYGNNGVRLGTTGLVTANAAGRRNIPLTSVLNLPPGFYWACLTATSTTGTFLSNSPTTHQMVGFQSCTSSTAGLPATLSFPCGQTARLVDVNIWGHVVGGGF